VGSVAQIGPPGQETRETAMTPILWKLAVRIFFPLLALSAAGVSAFAQMPPPQPVLVMNSTMVDPQTLGWLADDGRKALASAIAQQKSGGLYAFVFVGAPGGDAWSYRSTNKAADFLSVEELARAALQVCQFFENGPCYIISINGHDARDTFGGYPDQPDFLADQHGIFAATKIPFVTDTDQMTAASYATQTSPRAFVLTPNGYWLWRTGKTVFDAIAAAYTDCQKGAPGQVCVLYAVNDRVVFEPGHD